MRRLQEALQTCSRTSTLRPRRQPHERGPRFHDGGPGAMNGASGRGRDSRTWCGCRKGFAGNRAMVCTACRRASTRRMVGHYAEPVVWRGPRGHQFAANAAARRLRPLSQTGARWAAGKWFVLVAEQIFRHSQQPLYAQAAMQSQELERRRMDPAPATNVQIPSRRSESGWQGRNDYVYKRGFAWDCLAALWKGAQNDWHGLMWRATGLRQVPRITVETW